MNSPTISVIIPVYNNCATIPILYEQIRFYLDQGHLDFEVIFVNDASSDNSLKEIQILQNLFANVVLIDNKNNIGQQKSILKGLKFSKGKYCVVMDADLQDSPFYIPKLIEILHTPFEVAFALRSGAYQSRSRMLSSLLYKSITQVLSGLSKKAGTFFVIKSNLILRIVNLNCKTPYVTYMIACLVPNQIGYLYTKRRKTHTAISQYTTYKRMKAAMQGFFCIIECKYKVIVRQI